MLGILEKISPSELVSNGYISAPPPPSPRFLGIYSTDRRWHKILATSNFMFWNHESFTCTVNSKFSALYVIPTSISGIFLSYVACWTSCQAGKRSLDWAVKSSSMGTTSQATSSAARDTSYRWKWLSDLTQAERRPQNIYSQEEINLYCIIKLCNIICYLPRAEPQSIIINASLMHELSNFFLFSLYWYRYWPIW